VRVLLDTCVLSELSRPGCPAHVRDRVATLRDQDTFLSAITIGEIAHGAMRLEKGRKKDTLLHFLGTLEQEFQDRILPVDIETARIWGGITAAASKRGKAVPAIDGLIAATALQHGLQIMTRNMADFASTGALCIDPWEE